MLGLVRGMQVPLKDLVTDNGAMLTRAGGGIREHSVVPLTVLANGNDKQQKKGNDNETKGRQRGQARNGASNDKQGATKGAS